MRNLKLLFLGVATATVTRAAFVSTARAAIGATDTLFTAFLRLVNVECGKTDNYYK